MLDQLKDQRDVVGRMAAANRANQVAVVVAHFVGAIATVHVTTRKSDEILEEKQERRD